MKNTNSIKDKYLPIVKKKDVTGFLRKIFLPLCLFAICLLFLIGCTSSKKEQTGQESKASGIQQKSRIVTQEKSAFYNAIYLQKEGGMLLSGNRISEDNGRTWNEYNYISDFYSNLPHGFRRDKLTSVLDPYTNRIITIVNSLNTPGLDPKVNEPPEAQFTYYLRYMVSKNAGKTWLYDEPIIHEGNYTESNPFEEINIGENSFYIGDLGCIPIVTQKGKILVPAQMTIAGEDGKLSNPGGGRSYTDVLILIGTWNEDGKLTWKSSQRVKGDPKRSTRGMIEPTILELKDGRILMVMRGSNGFKFDEDNKLPSYKWHSVSDDGGETWTKPEPWGFEDGEPFFSPSAMSTLFKHSSGRCFWVGNMTKENCVDNGPRWPLVIGEVNTNNLKLIRSSVIIVDTQNEADLSVGRLDISHITLIEDRETKEIILSYPRNLNKYKNTEWVTVRFTVDMAEVK